MSQPFEAGDFIGQVEKEVSMAAGSIGGHKAQGSRRTRVSGAGKTRHRRPAARALDYRPRLIVKFHDTVKLPYVKGAHKNVEREGIGAWSKLAAQFRGIELNPYFTLPQATIEKLIDRALKHDPSYTPASFFTYFHLTAPLGTEIEPIARELRAWKSVQFVAPHEGAPPVTAVSPEDDTEFANQLHHAPAPLSIDAPFAWQFPGGGGEGVGFVDVENGWDLAHEDFAGADIPLVFGDIQDSPGAIGHGNSMLGVVAAQDNAVGCVGIAPHASAKVSSVCRNGGFNLEDAVLAGAAALEPGDVLLIEVHAPFFPSNPRLVPPEAWRAGFDAIKLTTSGGVIVVEGAGNGRIDLDTVNPADRNDGFVTTLNRTHPNFRDSGAIMVGAANSGMVDGLIPRSRLASSNFGNRVDCFAWGDRVQTPFLVDRSVTPPVSQYSWGGETSAAAAMVAGAAVVVQGLSKAASGFHYTPTTIRAWFKDPNTSTPSNNPAQDRIGRMPDLREIAYRHLWIPPDVYVRDYVGDTGDGHEGFEGRSPDIIMVRERVDDPQASFGEQSDTTDRVIGSRIGITGERYLYVRMRNRGQTDARDVHARVFWAPLSTFILPSQWQLIGETVVNSVPAGDILTVADAIRWSGDDMPGSGTFALIAVLDHPLDPFVPIADFGDADIIAARIGWQNNVAHRTYEFLAYQERPSGIVTVMPLGVDLGGPLDIPLQFEIDLNAQLPRGSSIWVETQSGFARSEGARVERLKGGRVRMQFKPNGRQKIGEVMLSKKAQPLQVLVHLPKGTKTSHEVYVSQRYRGQEVGRVTWRIVPPEGADRPKRRTRK